MLMFSLKKENSTILGGTQNQRKCRAPPCASILDSPLLVLLLPPIFLFALPLLSCSFDLLWLTRVS